MLPSSIAAIRPLLALAIGAGCASSKDATSNADEEETVAPGPWEDMETIPLESARVLLEPEINDAAEPTELALMPDRGLAFVLDTKADRVHVLDNRYGHDGRSYCIDPDDVATSTPKGASTECPDRTTEIHRGSLRPGDPPVAMGVDAPQRSVAMLTRSGVLFEATADILTSHPLDFLTVGAGTEVNGLRVPVSDAHVAAHMGQIAIAAQNVLLIIEGEDTSEIRLPGAAMDIALDDDGPIVATDRGVWSSAGTVEAVGEKLVQWQGDWWLVQVEENQVLRLEDSHSIEVKKLTGPAASDPRTDVLHLASTAGLVRITPDETQTKIDIDSPIDLDINEAGETVLLHPEGALTVLVDETTYDTDTPLDVFITTFSERPRNDDDAVACSSEGANPSIASFIDRALLNRSMLDDLPAPVGIGLTAALVRQAAECGEKERLVKVIDHPETSPGLLVHEDMEECHGNRSCHTTALGDLLSQFSGKLTPSWLSGMSTHHELDLDWVRSIEEAGLPSRYLFFGMSILPDIPHHSDLRAKNPWPRDLGDMSRAWSTDSAAAIAERDGRGWLTVYPGDDIPAFNLAGCENLLILECHPLLRGGGVVLDSEDVAILDLLLHRALADTTGATARSWSFHLPDIGTYNYTDGCTDKSRIWSGESCAAARLQEWLIDVDRRLVSAGVAAWTTPGELSKP